MVEHLIGNQWTEALRRALCPFAFKALLCYGSTCSRLMATCRLQFREFRMSFGGVQAVDRKVHGRSAITNGKLLPRGFDQRSSAARRFRDLVTAFARELGQGEALSTREAALVKQAAAIVVRIEALQSAIVSGAAVDDDAIVRLSNTAHRLLSSLASGRKRKRPAPDLGELIKSVEGRGS